jgi:hypothetical protein
MAKLSGETLPARNGRLMAAYGCYDLNSNPHRKGSRAHAAFVAAFILARGT